MYPDSLNDIEKFTQAFHQSLSSLTKSASRNNPTLMPKPEPATVSIRAYRSLTRDELNGLPRTLFATMMRNRVGLLVRGTVEHTETALESAEEWLSLNCSGLYHVHVPPEEDNTDLIVAFEEEADLVHFTLRSETP